MNIVEESLKRIKETEKNINKYLTVKEINDVIKQVRKVNK